MTCPNCGALVSTDDPAPIVDLVICTTCLASLVASTGLRATEANTLTLTPEQLKALRARRTAARGLRVNG